MSVIQSGRVYEIHSYIKADVIALQGTRERQNLDMPLQEYCVGGFIRIVSGVPKGGHKHIVVSLSFFLKSHSNEKTSEPIHIPNRKT